MSRNAGLLLAARIVSAVTTLVVLAIVARLRGPEALGAVGLGFALGSMAAAISDAGTASLLIRESARRPTAAGELLGAGLLVRLLTIPATLLAVAAVGALVDPRAMPTIVLVAAGLVAQQTAELTRSVFIARQRMTVSAGHAIVENLAWLVVVAAGLASGATLESTFALALAIMGGSVLVGLVLTSRMADAVPRRPRMDEMGPLAAKAGPFLAFNTLGIAYSRIDTVLIGALVSGPALAVAGAYFAATRVVAAFEYLPDAVSRAAYPELARQSVDASGDVASVLRSTASTLLIIGGLIPGLMLVAGGTVMAVMLGSAFATEGWLLAGLALAVPLRFLGHLYGITLTSADAQGRRVAAAGLALVLIVVIDVLLIPVVGLAAAVTASVGAAALVLALYARFVRQRFGSLGLGWTLVTFVVLAAVIAAGVGLLVRPLTGEIPAAGAAVLAYAAVLAAGPARTSIRSGWRTVAERVSGVASR